MRAAQNDRFAGEDVYARRRVDAFAECRLSYVEPHGARLARAAPSAHPLGMRPSSSCATVSAWQDTRRSAYIEGLGLKPHESNMEARQT